MTPVPLTADLIAHAIVASARAFSTCPVAACEAKSGMMRRPLTAAAFGIVRASGAPERRVSRILGLGVSAVSQARAMGSGTFWKASLAAEEAIRGHLDVQPEASIPEVVVVKPPPVPEGTAAASPPPPKPTFTPPKAGAISAPIRPAPFVGTPPARKYAAGPEGGTLRGRILATLKDAGATAPNLAILVDAKEMPIAETLRQMEREGLVVAGPVPLQGQRHRSWSLAERVSA